MDIDLNLLKYYCIPNTTLDYNAAFSNILAQLRGKDDKTESRYNILLKLEKQFLEKEKEFYQAIFPSARFENENGNDASDWITTSINNWNIFHTEMQHFFAMNKNLLEDMKTYSTTGIRANAKALEGLYAEPGKMSTEEWKLRYLDPNDIRNNVELQADHVLRKLVLDYFSTYMTDLTGELKEEFKEKKKSDDALSQYSRLMGITPKESIVTIIKNEIQKNCDWDAIISKTSEDYSNALATGAGNSMVKQNLLINIQDALKKASKTASGQDKSITLEFGVKYQRKKDKQSEVKGQSVSLNLSKICKESMGKNSITYNWIYKVEPKKISFSEEEVNKSNNTNSGVNPYIAKRAISGDKNFLQNLSTEDIKALNNSLLEWITSRDLYPKSDILRQYLGHFKDNSTDKELLRAFATPQGIVGYLSEISTNALFNSIQTGKSSDHISAEQIGGSGTNRTSVFYNTAAQLSADLSAWREGMQPAIDVLVKLSNNNKAKMAWGIQNKNAYSAKALLDSHEVSFVGEKSIIDILESDELKTVDKPNKLTELLLGYFGNRDIQKILPSLQEDKKKKSKQSDNIKKSINTQESNWASAIILINQIMDYFITEIMDIGFYQEEESTTPEGKKIALITQERNLFFMFLNSYFIPASALLGSVLEEINTAKNKKSYLSVQGSLSLKDDSLKNIFNEDYVKEKHVIPINPKEDPISSYVRMSVGYKFQKEVYDNFNLLSMIEHDTPKI